MTTAISQISFLSLQVLDGLGYQDHTDFSLLFKVLKFEQVAYMRVPSLVKLNVTL